MPVVNRVAVPGGLLPDAKKVDENDWNVIRDTNVKLRYIIFYFGTAVDRGEGVVLLFPVNRPRKRWPNRFHVSCPGSSVNARLRLNIKDLSYIKDSS